MVARRAKSPEFPGLRPRAGTDTSRLRTARRAPKQARVYRSRPSSDGRKSFMGNSVRSRVPRRRAAVSCQRRVLPLVSVQSEAVSVSFL